MTKISEQVSLLKRIIASKKKHKDLNVQSGQITSEQAEFEIKCLEDAMQTLAQIGALIKPMV